MSNPDFTDRRTPLDPEWCVELTVTAYVRAPSQDEAEYHADQLAEHVVLTRQAQARGYSIDDVRDVARIEVDEDAQQEG